MKGVDLVSIYINSLENDYKTLSGTIERFLLYDMKLSQRIIRLALESNNVNFIKKIPPNSLDFIILGTSVLQTWQQIGTEPLKKCPKILEILSKCGSFPSRLYLVQFLQDVQKEINDGANFSATKEAIEILIKANEWDLADCEQRISNPQEKVVLMDVLLRLNVLPPSKQNAPSDKVEEVVEEKDPETNQEPSPSTSAHNSWVDRIVQVVQPVLSKLLNIISTDQNKSSEVVEKKDPETNQDPQEVKQEKEEVVEEVEKKDPETNQDPQEVKQEKEEVEQVAEQVVQPVVQPVAEPCNSWKKVEQQLGMLGWRGYPFLKQDGKYTGLDWITKNDNPRSDNVETIEDILIQGNDLSNLHTPKVLNELGDVPTDYHLGFAPLTLPGSFLLKE